jgi:hypothetical protein
MKIEKNGACRTGEDVRAGLVGKAEAKRPLERPRRRFDNNIKIIIA